jgi:beta-phosphoglucomutase-like phosphatase (HAD superfamily)
MRAVLFDFDGVLVNSEPLHYRALRECLLPEGIDISEEEYAGSYLAYDDAEAIRVALEKHGHAFDGTRVRRVAERKAALFDELLDSVPFFPGAAELVRELAREVPLAIASGALHQEIERILTAGGLRQAFTAIVAADDVTRGKPHPEPYLTAMSAVAPRAPGLAARDCLVIEDSMPGIAAGRAAGMKVLAVATSYPAERLGAAHRVVASLQGLRTADLRALFD